MQNVSLFERPYERLAQADAVEWLRTLGDESVDLVVTDPAYESLEKYRAIGTTTRLKHSDASSNDWFEIFPNARFPELMRDIYRVLRRDAHFYFFCDAETMFVAKPIAEAAGFKFWKPIVWDKCLAGDTPVMTTRGVVPIRDVAVGHTVVTATGRAQVLAVRESRSAARAVVLDDGTRLVCSGEHTFFLASGDTVEAEKLSAGDRLLISVAPSSGSSLSIRSDSLIPPERLVYELPETSSCLWCERPFRSAKAASAHQSRFCHAARSKLAMSEQLGVPVKRLMWWLGQRMIPAQWVDRLGLRAYVTGRARASMQNDSKLNFPERIPLDYSLGRIVGLYAAQGSKGASGVVFSLNANKRDSHNFIARFARNLGLRSHLQKTSEGGVVVSIGYDFMRWLIEYFITGDSAPEKSFLPPVYEAPECFRDGVFDGLIDGDGHFSFDEFRDTFCSTSLDLTHFILRVARERGWPAKVSRHVNSHLGFWRVRFDRSRRADGVHVVSNEPCGEVDLFDIAIESPHRYLLGNGVVTHNCTIGMGYHYRARYEFVLFFEKGKRRLNNLAVADIIECPRIRTAFPTQKPVAVLRVLIEQSSAAGELVVDPFMGSGSVGESAVRTGRKFAGCDLSPKAVELTRERLRGLESI